MSRLPAGAAGSRRSHIRYTTESYAVDRPEGARYGGK